MRAKFEPAAQNTQANRMKGTGGMTTYRGCQAMNERSDVQADDDSSCSCSRTLRRVWGQMMSEIGFIAEPSSDRPLDGRVETLMMTIEDLRLGCGGV